MVTSTPAAGWYADPSDPSLERWWDGTQWSATQRPLATAVLTAPVPVATLAPPSYSTDADFGPAGFASAGFAVASSSLDFSRVETTPAPTGPEIPDRPPANGIAIAGFVLSLVGGGLLSLILSILGLRKAREAKYAGHGPVGRAFARWGIALSVLGLIATLIAALSVPAWLRSLESGFYDPAVVEQQLTAFFLEEDAPVSLVECPETGSFSTGTVLPCAVTFQDGTTGIATVTMGSSTEDSTVEFVQI